MQLAAAEVLVVPGHVDDELFEFVRDSRPTIFATVLASVIFLGHKLAMPFQKGVRREGTAYLTQKLSAQSLAKNRQPSSLSVNQENAFPT